MGPKSWTDDLPSCSNCGAGTATNQAYREDGSRHEANEFCDRSFHCKIDENTSLYAIFSGHDGSKVAESAIQRMAAEILLGQLNGKTSEEEIKDVLRQAFVSVENGYLDSVDSLLAQKAMLQLEIPDDISQYEVSQKYQIILDKLNAIKFELSIATSVVLVLIHYSKLYICNIGTCRAILCKTDANNVLRLIQLTVDHNITNEDEILRFCQLGVDWQALKLSKFESTRCIGNYLGKTGYKDCEYFYAASSEPIIAQPEIFGGIPIDGSFRFLLLMSSGLCKALEDIFSTETSQMNKEIVLMAVEQFRNQSTIMGVAQSVVNKIVQWHHDMYMQQIQGNNSCKFKSHNDMTLLVRNFNFTLPNAIQNRNNQVRFNPVVREHSNLIRYTESEMNSIFGNTDSSNSSYMSTTNSTTSETSDNPAEVYDKNKKTLPYVDFTDYFKRVEEAKKNKKLPTGIDFD